MGQQADETLDVLRGVWRAHGQTVADLDETLGEKQSCKAMKDVGFDGLAGDDADLRASWRAKLEREGKLNVSGASIGDLVLGSE